MKHLRYILQNIAIDDRYAKPAACRWASLHAGLLALCYSLGNRRGPV